MNTTTELKPTEAPHVQSSTEAKPATKLRPHVDLVEQEHAFTMHVEMPGVDHHSVDISVERNLLTITGNAEFTAPEGARPVSGDFSRRIYQRAFQLSDEIDQASIQAEMKNGVLTLTLPKTQRAQRASIPVREG